MFEVIPPCVGNRKAYELSNKMSSILQLEPLPLLNILTYLFQNYPHSIQDIALNFIPSYNDDDTERAKKNLNRVFKFMDAQESLLQTSISGAKLLVFTSIQLNIEFSSRESLQPKYNGWIPNMKHICSLIFSKIILFVPWMGLSKWPLTKIGLNCPFMGTIYSLKKSSSIYAPC